MRSVIHKKSMIKNKNSSYVVEYGLSYLNGNDLPYFSVTVTAPDWMRVSTGCCHDDVLQVYPDMADIIDLHLCSPYGDPMHDIENGWYWYSSYDGGGTHINTKDDIEVFAKHMRISVEDARSLRIKNTRDKDGSIPRSFIEFVDSQRERWRREADAVIEKYDLHGWNE